MGLISLEVLLIKEPNSSVNDFASTITVDDDHDNYED